MYVKSADAIGNLQPSEDPAGLKNRLVTSDGGDYIYSQYNKSGGTAIQTPSSNVFVPLSTSTQSNGLDMIFGYVNAAGSAIEYEIQQLNVRYVSDSNGTINGIKDEVKFLNDTASGSSSEPNENYVFSHWIADKNVTLTDGTTIQAGKPITSEQLKKVVVETNLTFTAIHKTKEEEKPEIVVPDTGASTGNHEGTILVNLAAVFAALGVVVSLVRRHINHRLNRVHFNKK